MDDIRFPDMFMFNDLVDFANEIGAKPSLGDYAIDFEPSIYDFKQGQIFEDYLVYIRDFESEGVRRFHLCCCQTIFEFIKHGRYGYKYKKIPTSCVKIKKDGRSFDHFFPVYLIDLKKEKNKVLKPCKHCLETLNYKNYKYENERKRESIYRNFSLVDFLEEYKVNVPHTDHYDDGLYNVYSDDWSSISKRLRKRASWKCEICGADYSQDRKNLHVHHRNENKRDNRDVNLQVLCRHCHQKMHE